VHFFKVCSCMSLLGALPLHFRTTFCAHEERESMQGGKIVETVVPAYKSAQYDHVREELHEVAARVTAS
jgi:hypothetical protein